MTDSHDRPVLLVVIGSTRPGRIGDRVGRWFADRATERAAFDVRVADLAEIGLPMLDEPRHPRLGQYEHQHTREWSAVVSAADAVAFVTPEYNHGYTGALKNAVDYLYAEWRDKPAAFVSYGGVAGGTRAVQQLKPVLVAVGMVPLNPAVTIPFAHRLVTADGVAATDDMTAAADAVLDEVARMTGLMRGPDADRDAARAG